MESHMEECDGWDSHVVSRNPLGEHNLPLHLHSSYEPSSSSSSSREEQSSLSLQCEEPSYSNVGNTYRTDGDSFQADTSLHTMGSNSSNVDEKAGVRNQNDERIPHRRRPIHCRRWKLSDDELLLRAMLSGVASNWRDVVTYLEEHGSAGWDPDQAGQHWSRVVIPILRTIGWTKEEDDKMLDAINSGLRSWEEIAHRIETRSSIECLKRFELLKSNHLLRRHFDSSRRLELENPASSRISLSITSYVQFVLQQYAAHQLSRQRQPSFQQSYPIYKGKMTENGHEQRVSADNTRRLSFSGYHFVVKGSNDSKRVPLPQCRRCHSFTQTPPSRVQNGSSSGFLNLSSVNRWLRLFPPFSRTEDAKILDWLRFLAQEGNPKESGSTECSDERKDVSNFVERNETESAENSMNSSVPNELLDQNVFDILANQLSESTIRQFLHVNRSLFHPRRHWKCILLRIEHLASLLWDEIDPYSKFSGLKIPLEHPIRSVIAAACGDHFKEKSTGSSSDRLRILQKRVFSLFQCSSTRTTEETNVSWMPDISNSNRMDPVEKKIVAELVFSLWSHGPVGSSSVFPSSTESFKDFLDTSFSSSILKERYRKKRDFDEMSRNGGYDARGFLSRSGVDKDAELQMIRSGPLHRSHGEESSNISEKLYEGEKESFLIPPSSFARSLNQESSSGFIYRREDAAKLLHQNLDPEQSLINPRRRSVGSSMSSSTMDALSIFAETVLESDAKSLERNSSSIRTSSRQDGNHSTSSDTQSEGLDRKRKEANDSPICRSISKIPLVLRRNLAKRR